MATTEDLLTQYPNDDSALHKWGELYRNADGHEVWRVRDEAGVVVNDDIPSDYDAMWLANSMVGGCDFADLHEDGLA